MTSFKSFFREEADPEDFVKYLRQHAPEYVNVIRPLGMCLIRGMNPPAKGIKLKAVGDVLDAQIHTPRKDRKPASTPLWAQEDMDDWFNNKFGVKPRSSGVFCVGSDRASVAQSYGRPHVIVPLGDFKFVWSPEVADLTVDLFNPWGLENSKSQDDDLEYLLGFKSEKYDSSMTKYLAATKFIHKFLDGSQYKDTDLSAAIKSGNEVMLICDRYLAIDYEMSTGTINTRVRRLVDSLYS